MDITLLIAAVALLVLAGAGLRARSKRLEEAERKDLLETVRLRSEKRAHERAFQDTQPSDEALESLTYGVEIDDRYDGRGDLTEEQNQVITAIFEEKKYPTLRVHARAGVPWSESVFNEENIVEYIEPKDIWAAGRGR